jgi:hypothetical protein
MTRRDYVMLSSALKRATDRAENADELNGVRAATEEIAGAIAERSSAFDTDQFKHDSGVAK